jgi:hypothetical protein
VLDAPPKIPRSADPRLAATLNLDTLRKGVNAEEEGYDYVDEEEETTKSTLVDVMPTFHVSFGPEYPDVSQKMRRLRRYGTI